jgi:hypothetical protein
MMLNPCSPCCKTCCFVPLLISSPDVLYGQSTIDGSIGPVVLVKDLNGPGDPNPLRNGVPWYFALVDVVPDGTTCYPDKRVGPVQYQVFLDVRNCSPYMVVTTPNYNPGFAGRAVGLSQIVDDRGDLTGFFVNGGDPGVGFYMQSAIWNNPAVAGAVSGVTFRLYRYQYAGFGGFYGTVTPGPLIFTGRVPLHTQSGFFPAPAKCDPSGVAFGISPGSLFVPAEFAYRGEIATNGQSGTPPVPYGFPYDAVFQITGSGTLYDGWFVGVRAAGTIDGPNSSIRVDICSDCGFAPTTSGVDNPYAGFGTYLTGQDPLVYNSTYPQTQYQTDPSGKTMAFTADLLGGGGFFYGSPYPPTLIPNPDGTSTWVSDCIRVEVDFDP